MAINNTGYSKVGEYTLVPLADMTNINASVNIVGDARKGVGRTTQSTSLGKRAGMMVMVDHGSTQYSLAIALGGLASSKWQSTIGIATQYTPV